MADRSGVMLAYAFKEKRLTKYPRPWIIQPKIEGDRCRAVIDSKGKCTLLSSSEKVISHVPHINKQFEHLGWKNIEVDGELYKHGMSHSEIHSRCASSRKYPHPDHEMIEFWAFDFISGKVFWEKDKSAKPLIPPMISGRWVYSAGVLQSGTSAHKVWRYDITPTSPTLDRLMALHAFKFAKRAEVHDIIDVTDRFAEGMPAIRTLYESFLDRGFEGIIIRNPQAPYVRKKTTTLMKLKPRLSDVFPIVGVKEEHTITGQPKNALGAFMLRTEEGRVFNVGSGFTRKQREDYWRDSEKIVGKMKAKIRYQGLTPYLVPYMQSFKELVQ